MSNALPVSRDTGYPGEWCRDKLTSDHSLGLQYCRGLALYLLTDCRRLLHGGWWSRDTCCCWRHFFGMVILMTFVATLAIYGIASRNFILVSPMDFLVIYPEMTCITRSSAVAKRPRDAHSFNTKRRAQSFIISCFGFRIYHCVQLNSFLFSSLRRIGPCCRPSQTNIHWCVADCAIYTTWSSVTVFVTS